jgi:hypothetical protein
MKINMRNPMRTVAIGALLCLGTVPVRAQGDGTWGEGYGLELFRKKNSTPKIGPQDLLVAKDRSDGISLRWSPPAPKSGFHPSAIAHGRRSAPANPMVPDPQASDGQTQPDLPNHGHGNNRARPPKETVKNMTKPNIQSNSKEP